MIVICDLALNRFSRCMMIHLALFILCAVVPVMSLDISGAMMPAFMAMDLLRGRGPLNGQEVTNITKTERIGITSANLTTIPLNLEFKCSQVHQPGYYANMEPVSRCQVYHRCETGLPLYTYLCPVGKLFNQITLNCDYFFNVRCEKSGDFYDYSNPRLYLGPNVTFLDNGNSSQSTNPFLQSGFRASADATDASVATDITLMWPTMSTTLATPSSVSRAASLFTSPVSFPPATTAGQQQQPQPQQMQFQTLRTNNVLRFPVNNRRRSQHIHQRKLAIGPHNMALNQQQQQPQFPMNNNNMFVALEPERHFNNFENTGTQLQTMPGGWHSVEQWNGAGGNVLPPPDFQSATTTHAAPVPSTLPPKIPQTEPMTPAPQSFDNNGGNLVSNNKNFNRAEMNQHFVGIRPQQSVDAIARDTHANTDSRLIDGATGMGNPNPPLGLWFGPNGAPAVNLPTTTPFPHWISNNSPSNNQRTQPQSGNTPQLFAQFPPQPAVNTDQQQWQEPLASSVGLNQPDNILDNSESHFFVNQQPSAWNTDPQSNSQLTLSPVVSGGNIDTVLHPIRSGVFDLMAVSKTQNSNPDVNWLNSFNSNSLDASSNLNEVEMTTAAQVSPLQPQFPSNAPQSGGQFPSQAGSSMVVPPDGRKSLKEKTSNIFNPEPPAVLQSNTDQLFGDDDPVEVMDAKDSVLTGKTDMTTTETTKRSELVFAHSSSSGQDPLDF